MNNILKCIILVILIQSTTSIAQTIIKVDRNYYETTYFDKTLNLYFNVPNDWTVTSIPVLNNKEYPTGIGLRPKDWGYSTDSNGDTLEQSEYAVQIEVSSGSIDPKSKNIPEDTVDTDSQDGSDLSFNVEIGELNGWRYHRSEEPVRIYKKNGGYWGMGSYYICTLDNRHGKCVCITSDPQYDGYDEIKQIEKSIRFK